MTMPALPLDRMAPPPAERKDFAEGVSRIPGLTGLRCRCHRHFTRSTRGTVWDSSVGGLGLRRLRRAADAAAGEDRLDLGGAIAQFAQDVGPVLADMRRVLLRLVLRGARQAGNVGDRQAPDALL